MADEYISREAASERLHKLIVNFYSAYEKDGKDERLAALLELDLAARSVINAIPAADVAPVVHAHWGRGSEDGRRKCSHCGMYEHERNYCGFCGARMDESEEEE